MIVWAGKYLRLFMDYLNVSMSAALHNWCIISTLALVHLTGVSLLVRFLVTGQDIPVGALTLLEYELAALATMMGVVGGLHTIKSVKGVESESKNGAPVPPATPEPKPD